MVEEYIKERMTQFAMNIDEFKIGDIIGKVKITDKTRNSIEVSDGRYLQWHTMNSFIKLSSMV